MSLINDIKQNFTAIPNKMIQDPSLYAEAKLLYALLASKPKTWEFCFETLSKEIGCGINAVKKYLRELSNTGWVTIINQEKDQEVIILEDIKKNHKKKG